MNVKFEGIVWMYKGKTKPEQHKQYDVWAAVWSTGEFEVNPLHSDSSGDADDLHSEVCGSEFVSGDRISCLRFSWSS